MVAFLAVATMTIGPAWGQTSQTSTLNFTAAYGSGPATAGGNVQWTVTSDGNESNFDNTKGIHYGTGKLQVQYIQLSTSGIEGTITKVKVNASTASGVNNATVGVTVGGNAFGGNAQSLSINATDYTFTGSATGAIVVRVEKPSAATGALYVKSIEVTYTPASSGGGSGSETPTPGQNASEENIFQYCYDCQRSPAYPKTTASASLSGFANPLVGYNGSGFEVNNTSAGPWKLEYMGIWSTTDNHGINGVSNYQSIYNCTDVPVFRLYQWNATANEYQHAAYGVVCAYAKVTNAVEHTALFVAEGGWGCVLTNSSHSSSMNITFDEDLTTGLTTLIPAPAVPHTVRFAAGNDGWTVTDVDSARSATAPAVLQNVMAGDSLVVTAPATLPGKVKSVKAVKYVPPVLVSSIVLDKQTAYLAKDSTLTLTASVLPENAADKSYTWSSDDITKAYVNQNGVVTGVAGGTANIIATANDGSGVKDTCVVTVLSSVTLEGVTVLYASENDTWETVIGYNPGVLYQDDYEVRLTSNDAFLSYYGDRVHASEFIYPFYYNEYQWMRVLNIYGANFIYHQGETWQEAIDANRPNNQDWSIENGQVKIYGNQILVDNTTYEPVDPTATIDPSTVNYDLSSDN